MLRAWGENHSGVFSLAVPKTKKIIWMCVFVLKIFGQTWSFFCLPVSNSMSLRFSIFFAPEILLDLLRSVLGSRERLMLIIWQSNHRDMTSSPKASFMTYIWHLGRFHSGIVEDGPTELWARVRGAVSLFGYQQTLMWSFYNVNCSSCGRGRRPLFVHPLLLLRNDENRVPLTSVLHHCCKRLKSCFIQKKKPVQTYLPVTFAAQLILFHTNRLSAIMQRVSIITHRASCFLQAKLQ